MNTFTIGLGVNGTLPNTSDTLAGSDRHARLRLHRAGAADSQLAHAVGTERFPHRQRRRRDQRGRPLARCLERPWPVLLGAHRGQLSSAISSVINSISAVKGSGSGSSTSSLQLVPGDSNQGYQATYTTSDWTGDVVAKTLNGDGTSAPGQIWSASDLLDSATYTGRKIYFNSGGTLTAFTYANLSTAQKAYFDKFCSLSVTPSQCTTLASATADLTAANTGTNLVNYLRGDRTLERPVRRSPAERRRTRCTGRASMCWATSSMVRRSTSASRRSATRTPATPTSSAAMPVARRWSTPPPMTACCMRSRRPPAVADPSCGHSSDADDAQPLPARQCRLFDSHRFFVDGAPTEGDAYLGGTWKTILVGGFNSGGRGYYALDITDPANPRCCGSSTATPTWA